MNAKGTVQIDVEEIDLETGLTTGRYVIIKGLVEIEYQSGTYDEPEYYSESAKVIKAIDEDGNETKSYDDSSVELSLIMEYLERQSYIEYAIKDDYKRSINE